MADIPIRASESKVTESLDAPVSLVGSVTILVDDDELLFSTGETWDADG